MKNFECNLEICNISFKKCPARCEITHILILTKYNLIACLNQKGLIAYTFLRYFKKKKRRKVSSLKLGLHVPVGNAAFPINFQRDALWSGCGESSTEEADWLYNRWNIMTDRKRCLLDELDFRGEI